MDKSFIDEAKSLISFIESSPSVFHVVRNMERIATEKGFIELKEELPFNLERGKSYFVSRNGSALIAFRVPKGDFKGYRVAAAHTDSPTFKIKGNPEVNKDGHTVINTEKYGGALISAWFDRPLSVAGRVFGRKDGKIVERLVSLDRDALLIPSLAIHMDRSQNDGVKHSLQKELLPLFSDSYDGKSFMDEVANEAGMKSEDILSHDLYLYNRMKGTIWGHDGCFFSSGKIDDLMCVHAIFKALMEKEEAEGYMPIAVFFDSEEVGSGTFSGALSDFLRSTLSRIECSLGMGKEDAIMKIRNSFLVSADNGHSVHPNYPEKADISNKPRMNGGVLVKHDASGKYTTDGKTSSFVKGILEESGIPCQDFFNNSDIPGGTTLGRLSLSEVSIPSADIGAAEVAMHSPYETAGTKDAKHLLDFFKAYLFA